jgi:hypothetical protein
MENKQCKKHEKEFAQLRRKSSACYTSFVKAIKQKPNNDDVWHDAGSIFEKCFEKYVKDAAATYKRLGLDVDEDVGTFTNIYKLVNKNKFTDEAQQELMKFVKSSKCGFDTKKVLQSYIKNPGDKKLRRQANDVVYKTLMDLQAVQTMFKEVKLQQPRQRSQHVANRSRQ